jgi:hypothetical protein
MASLNASITSTGLISTGDASGNLDLQSNGTTGLSVRSGGKVVLANTALSTASAGTLEYDGGELYFTPLGTQRGLVSSAQYFRLDSSLAGANVNTAQSIFGVGVTLSANTVYYYEHLYVLTKTAGTTSHNLSYQFGGTATTNNILWYSHYSNAGIPGSLSAASATHAIGASIVTSSVAGTVGITTASITFIHKGSGTVSIATGGTFIPQYILSAAPGGAYTTAAGSYFLIYPIGASGSNVSIGTWA